MRDFGGRKALNELGQVAFHARLADGREGVFLWSPPTPAGLRITLTGFDEDDVLVTLSSKEGFLYQLQRRSSAASGAWIDEGDPVTGTGGEIELRHIGGAKWSKQLYVVVESAK